jgi:nitrite reductase/ring-hydroxylating ferredoxin subunit
MEDVPCNDLTRILEGLIRHGAFKAMREQLRKIARAPVAVASSQAQTEQVGPIIRPQDIPEGSAKMFRMNGDEVAVFKRDGQLCAIQNICPHEGGQLSKGWIDGEEAVCPLHGYRFHLKTGVCSSDPSLKVRTFGLVADGEGFKINRE